MYCIQWDFTMIDHYKIRPSSVSFPGSVCHQLGGRPLFSLIGTGCGQSSTFRRFPSPVPSCRGSPSSVLPPPTHCSSAGWVISSNTRATAEISRPEGHHGYSSEQVPCEPTVGSEGLGGGRGGPSPSRRLLVREFQLGGSTSAGDSSRFPRAAVWPGFGGY